MNYICWNRKFENIFLRHMRGLWDESQGLQKKTRKGWPRTLKWKWGPGSNWGCQLLTISQTPWFHELQFPLATLKFYLESFWFFSLVLIKWPQVNASSIQVMRLHCFLSELWMPLWVSSQVCMLFVYLSPILTDKDHALQESNGHLGGKQKEHSLR